MSLNVVSMGDLVWRINAHDTAENEDNNGKKD